MNECSIRALFHVLGEELLTIADCNPDTGIEVCGIRAELLPGVFKISDILDCQESATSNFRATCMANIRWHANQMFKVF